jgi:hypothetical protein
MPNCETEMLRLSDDRTEAAIAVLYEPHYSGFKKKQASSPDKLVEEDLSVTEGFDCRAIEISPMIVDDTPELGAINDDEDPEESAKADILYFVQTYQNYDLFRPQDAPLVSAIRELYRLSIPENFAETRQKRFYGCLSDFSEYIYFVTDLGLSLANARTTIHEMLECEELINSDIEELRTLWQISLNQEYWRGYNDALDKIKVLATERNLEGYEEIIKELKAQIPDDLAQLCDRLRIWIGRLQLSEQNLVPTMQTEFRPK